MGLRKKMYSSNEVYTRCITHFITMHLLDVSYAKLPLSKYESERNSEITSRQSRPVDQVRWSQDRRYCMP